MINSNSAKRFCSFLLCMLITLGLLLGSSVVAYADDTVTIGGVLCKPVTLTNDMVKAMFDAGDCSLTYYLAAQNGNITLNVYDSSEQSKTVVTLESSEVYNFTDFNTYIYSEASVEWLGIGSDKCYSLRTHDSDVYVTEYIDIVFPFEYYYYNTDIGFRTFYSGDTLVNNSEVFVRVKNSDNETIYNYSESIQRSPLYWSNSYATSYFYNNVFNRWLPEDGLTYTSNSSTGIRTNRCGFAPIISTTEIGSSLEFNARHFFERNNAASVLNAYYAPIWFNFRFNCTVYVPVNYEELVTTYLGLITDDPTPENQQAIEDLKDQFQTKEQELSDLAEDLTVVVPDTSGAISGLPAEAQAGANDFATYIFTPIYNIPIVGILVACAFGFAIIKLLLYGSGST